MTGLMLLGAALLPDTSSADPLGGKGSIGFSLGAMRYTGNADFSDDARVRPTFHAVARYAFENRFTMSLDGGYGWNAYGEGGDYRGPDTTGTVAVALPITLGIDYRFGGSNPKFIPHVGAGVGAYLFTIRAGRERLSRDRINYRNRRHAAPGGYARLGADYAALESMVLNAELMYHLIPMSDSEGFPGGYFDSAASFAEVRVGLSYYFTVKSTGPSPSGDSDAEDEE